MTDMSRPGSTTGSSPVRDVPQDVLAGPIIPTMLRLALPTTVVLVVQTFVGVAETYFISFLGTDALAGVTLVFPVLMLMQMMSNGGIGGGIASAVARALALVATAMPTRWSGIRSFWPAFSAPSSRLRPFSADRSSISRWEQRERL
jgi:hypothetical protein